jgi:hypothetical protein
MQDVEHIRARLSGRYLDITNDNSLLFDNVDLFVTLSRENTSVRELEFYPFDSDAGNYEILRSSVFLSAYSTSWGMSCVQP